MKVESMERHADELLDLLVDCGPMTKATICEKLGWAPGRFDATVKYAREQVCPEMELSIPAPTPGGGWLYQVTTEWRPVEQGASYALGLVETRLRSIGRDVCTVFPHLTPGTRDWRRANFLNKHLHHIIAVLSEIDNG